MLLISSFTMEKPIRNRVLLVDGVINLGLGVALLFFDALASRLGVPASDTSFYPMILGGGLFGIGIALVWECLRGEEQVAGLGLGGAIAINLCGGLVLSAWLVFGDLALPMRGQVFLWCLAAVLVLISLVELGVHARR